MARHTLAVEPLTAAAFAPFGDVIEAPAGAPHRVINDGFAQRFHDLAHIDTAADGGRVLVNIFRARPRTLPLHLRFVERHALGSQAFVALAPMRFLVVVAPPGPPPQAGALRAFVAAPGQGVNYARGTWHHPLIALDAGGDFLVVDRGADAVDCDVHALTAPEVWVDLDLDPGAV
jgi:ureidoglycolate lyase